MSSKKFKKYSYFYSINQYLLCKNQFIPNISTPLLVITIISRNNPTVFFYRIFIRTVCNHKFKSKNHIRLKNNIVSNRYACSETIILNFKVCRITILRFNIFSTSLSIFDALIPDLQKVKAKSIDCAIDAAFLIFSIAL